MDRNLMSKLNSAWQDHAATVESWKERNNRKAVGLVLTDVPEELVHAAGALPTTILGADVEYNYADKHLQGFSCAYSRSVVELAEGGSLDYLDGLIIPYACDTTRCLDLVFKFTDHFDFYDCLRLPKRNNADGLADYFEAELKRLSGRLSDLTGQRVTEEALKKSIADYNRVRALLGQVREIMRAGRSDASAYFSAVRAAMVMAPEDSEPILADFVADFTVEFSNSAPRVVLAGKLPEPPGVVDVIAQSGLHIVEDFLTVGGRWVAAVVLEDLPPWQGLVRRQIERLPFAGIWDCRPSRASYLIERVRQLSADGVVFMVQKFCEPAELDYPGIKEELEKNGIPSLLVETDFRATSLEVIRTRVEAFAEMLKS